MIREKGLHNTAFDILNYLFILLLGLLALAPMINLLAISLSGRAPSMGGYVTFWPKEFTLENYSAILSSPAVYRALGVSVTRTVLGTALSMFLTVITAYPLSKSSHEFKGRNIFVWLLVFTMLFEGGLIPYFMVIRRLGLLNTIWALVLPGVAVWNIILMLNFFKEVPKELEEAALLDGASHWQILWKVYLPLSLPALATLSLFVAVYHWNAWFDGMIFMTDNAKYPMQTYLRTVVINMNSMTINVDAATVESLSQRSMRGAMIFVSIIPILAVYPFVQRYFISGIKLGSVKG